MGPIDWAAIIGAGSWVPQITGWVARRVTRPAMRLVPSSAPEIGYTNFGPIFNLTCAISAEKKDAIVERMVVTVEHERGQKIMLTWVLLNEPTFEMRASEIVDVRKGQVAIALKVSTLLLAEKTIAFNDPIFQDTVRTQTNAVNERLSFLRRSDRNAADEIVKSKEFADLVALWERHFTWQEGQYTAHVDMRIAGLAKTANRHLAFTLTANDVERLRQNLPEIRRFQRDLIVPPTRPSTYNWTWVYPPFRR